MTLRIFLERFTLGLLTTLAGLAVLAFTAFVAIEALRWAILPSVGERFFTLALPLLAGGILALSLANIALNQGLMARAALAQTGVPVMSGRSSLRAGALTAAAGLGLVVLCLGALYLVNRANIREKSDEVRAEMRSLLRDSAQELQRLAGLVAARREQRDVVRGLAALATTTPYFRDLELILPLQHSGRTIYRVVPRWLSDSELRQRSIYQYGVDGAGSELSPNRFELDYLKQAWADRRAPAQPVIFVRRPQLRVICPLQDAQGVTVGFLLSDNHSFGRREDK